MNCIDELYISADKCNKSILNSLSRTVHWYIKNVFVIDILLLIYVQILYYPPAM